MILRFRVANHRSIRDEMELSFVAEDDSPYGRALDGQDGLTVLPAVAIYGANASGKSAVLNALAFASDAVRESHRSWEPDGGTPRSPSPSMPILRSHRVCLRSTSSSKASRRVRV